MLEHGGGGGFAEHLSLFFFPTAHPGASLARNRAAHVLLAPMKWDPDTLSGSVTWSWKKKKRWAYVRASQKDET